MRKLNSRKFIVSILVAVLALVLKQLNIPDQVILWVLGALMAWVGIEGTLDLASILKSKK